ncbi:MAG: hypothetical protein WAM05_01445 [Candidatus Binataceae bacterium]
MQHHGWPQSDADLLPSDAGIPENDYCAEIVYNHRGDQPSSGAALHVAACKPTGHA